jgi:MFS family permease
VRIEIPSVQSRSMPPVRNYLSQLRRFQSNARLYLLYSFASGFAMGIMRLLFNFYVLSLSYDRAFLGMLVALPPLVITAAAIPVGMLGHRIGYRAVLIGGAVFMAASVLGTSFSTGVVGLVLFAACRGLSTTMLQVSSAPFMTENSESTERTHLFSVQFATRMLASFFGLLLAGVLPSLVARGMSIGAEDPLAYRASLWVGAALLALAILPLLRMARLPESTEPRPRTSLREMFRPPGQLIRLFLPQVIIGFGAGALVPFLNVFFKTEFGLSDSVIGILYAFQSVVMALATLAAPIVAERLKRVRAVVVVQLLSIPFLILLGYAPLVSLSAIGFLARASLMNMGNPLYTSFAMEVVAPERRPTASALMQMSWQGTRGVSALVSGKLQEGPGFSALFPITIGCYLLASALIHTFFVRGKRREARQ